MLPRSRTATHPHCPPHNHGCITPHLLSTLTIAQHVHIPRLQSSTTLSIPQLLHRMDYAAVSTCGCSVEPAPSSTWKRLTDVSDDVDGDLIDEECVYEPRNSSGRQDSIKWLLHSSQWAVFARSCMFACFTALLLFALWSWSSPSSTTAAAAWPQSGAVPSSSCASPPSPSTLPSCSILNPNLTENLLHHARTIQADNVHADCTDFY